MAKWDLTKIEKPKDEIQAIVKRIERKVEVMRLDQRHLDHYAITIATRS